MTNHEIPRPHDNHEPTREPPIGPERERLYPGEIDLTGTVRQPNDLRDVIADALIEARASRGEIPDWGARAIARALADRLSELDSPALHTFAAVGRVLESISAELAAIYASPYCPPEIREWINYLGTYLISRSPQAEETETATAANDPPTPQDLFPGSALDQVSRYLRQTFGEADARGEVINEDDARAIATLLAPLLGPTSAMSQLADAGKVDTKALLAECHDLQGRTYRTTDIAEQWIPRLVRYLEHAPVRPTIEDGTDAETAPWTGQAAEGVREIGDAFRAFLMLDDVDPSRDDLIVTFHEWYVATFASRDKLLEGLTEVTDWEAAVAALAEEYGIEPFVHLDRNALWKAVDDAWEIVELNGHFHVFEK